MTQKYGSRSTPKIRQVTKIQEHTFLSKWEHMRSYDCARRVGCRDMKGVMQCQPQGKWRAIT